MAMAGRIWPTGLDFDTCGLNNMTSWLKLVQDITHVITSKRARGVAQID